MSFALCWFKRCLNVLLLVLVMAGQAVANEKELAIKAGFLFNFARYSEWSAPATPLGYFKLCSPDIEFVDKAAWILHERTVHDLPIKVSFVDLNSLEINQCNLLFVSSGFYQQWLSVDKSLLSNTMLVGENEEFIHQGGHIRFFLLAGKVRFAISPDALNKANIVMSSKVLRLSRIVKEEQP